MMESQNAAILAHLMSGKSITFFEAVQEFGVMHLPRRILDLKERGYNIQSQYIRGDSGKRFKEYWLPK